MDFSLCKFFKIPFEILSRYEYVTSRLECLEMETVTLPPSTPFTSSHTLLSLHDVMTTYFYRWRSQSSNTFIGLSSLTRNIHFPGSWVWTLCSPALDIHLLFVLLTGNDSFPVATTVVSGVRVLFSLQSYKVRLFY